MGWGVLGWDCLGLCLAVEQVAIGGAWGRAEEGSSTVSYEEAAIGYPFYHPPVSVRHLPASDSAAASHSLVHVPYSSLDLSTQAVPKLSTTNNACA